MSEVRVNNLSNENNTGGPTISGITTYSGRHFFVPPQGDTASRPSDCEPGSFRFNTDNAKLEYFRGNTIGWTEIEAEDVEIAGVSGSSGSIDGKGTRMLFAGGYTPSSNPNDTFNNVDAITVETQGNSIDFNNLTGNFTGMANFGDTTRAVAAGGIGPRAYAPGSTTNQIQFCTFASTGDYADSGGDLTRSNMFMGCFNNKVRGVICGGSYPYDDTMDYVTIQTLGNAVDYGDLPAKAGYAAGLSSSTRGFIIGGIRVSAPDTADYNTITVHTTSSTGDGTDFGDLSTTRYEMASGSNATRGIVAGGYGPNYTNIIQFITMATTGDASDFGDLTGFNGTGKGGAASPVRFVLGGGYGTSPHFMNTIEFVQIATTGNSKDFGDLQGFGRRIPNQVSNNNGGISG